MTNENKAYALTPFPELTKAKTAAAKLGGELAKIQEEVKARRSELDTLQAEAIEALAAGTQKAYALARGRMQDAEADLARLASEAALLEPAHTKAQEALAPIEHQAKAAWRRELLEARKALNGEGYKLLEDIEVYYQREAELSRLAQSIGMMVPILTHRIRMTPDAVRYLKQVFDGYHGA